eukprot:CAMPEP_0116118654 /NCGR_PEP_ID=MMETSP0329-20121206/2223_1 /TAXON_ID=697910 /ORGANISM="Pseudo-nitzschia arenysensis, Strain B593" /LENGTH=92 /DNA_ID=CAMNT_0003612303 /DNA_START=140 /DNA_END=418 /DNA_ORIENTATION=-
MMLKVKLIDKLVIQSIFVLQQLICKWDFNSRPINIELDHYEIIFGEALQDRVEGIELIAFLGSDSNVNPKGMYFSGITLYTCRGSVGVTSKA